MKKSITIKYDDFPEVNESPNIILDIINSGKKVTPSALAKYLKCSNRNAGQRLQLLEAKGLIKSRVSTQKDELGRMNHCRIYYKK